MFEIVRTLTHSEENSPQCEIKIPLTAELSCRSSLYSVEAELSFHFSLFVYNLPLCDRLVSPFYLI